MEQGALNFDKPNFFMASSFALKQTPSNNSPIPLALRARRFTENKLRDRNQKTVPSKL